ncbi:efflux RND transporter periplasmic adaptor subunit [Alicyclobacillus fastidiosus]|uniref:Efflux RND transporter periplasmic adaptor subunit n=1 Tax=Alicyclobacillus fastidiosus TaxID=392011 RepID=A0ABV5AEM2_9BACL|nr:efflux RND transporter periplasmic adaptor subunit [Alicyclobacillus fastidiosus]WEH09547.1 efflux RND transporter periplasmic adaptor subunit [Alicyclobacillus fastidiosus]
MGNLAQKHASLLIGVGLIAMGGVAGCGLKGASAKSTPIPPEAVSVQTVQLSSQSIGDTYLGTVTPYIQTTLAPAASGKLSQLNVRPGQAVQAGETLASLDPSTVVQQQSTVDQANAAVASAQQQYADAQALYNDNVSAEEQVSAAQSAVSEQAAALKAAKANLQKAQLQEQQALSGAASDSGAAEQAQSAVASAQASLTQAQAQYNAAVASLNEAKKLAADKTQQKQALDNAANALRQDQVQAQSAEKALEVQTQNGRVVSPIAGVVQSVGAQVGQQVGPQTTLITIASTSPVMTTVNVPESDIGNIHAGVAMNVQVPSLNETFTGKVLDVHPQLNQTTNQYPVDITIAGTHSQLLAGLQVEAQLANSGTKKVMLVPADAVLSMQSGAEEVFVEQNGVVHSRIVQVGAMSSTQYQITSGLEVGDKIVVQGQNLLSDGDKVKVVSDDGSKAN